MIENNRKEIEMYRLHLLEMEAKEIERLAVE